MASKYTYFISYTYERNSASMTVNLDSKLNSPEKINNLCVSLSNHHDVSGVCLVNFILLSETHEPEKTDSKKDILNELYELFLRHDIRLKSNHKSFEIFSGDKSLYDTDCCFTDADDIKYAIDNFR